jgi:hypothetical protein
MPEGVRSASSCANPAVAIRACSRWTRASPGNIGKHYVSYLFMQGEHLQRRELKKKAS